MRRNTLGISRRTVLLLYVGAGALTGALAGAALGWLGGHLATPARLAAMTALGLVGLAWAVAAVRGRWRRPILQCDVETPQRWVFDGAIAWPLKNGAALGLGMFTRLGFVLWYAVPAGALLSGSWIAGAVVYGAYGATRTGCAAVIWTLGRRRGDVDPIIGWLERQHPASQRVAAVHLLLLSAATVATIGL